MVELVVGSQRWKSSCADGVGEEDLGGWVDPSLRIPQLWPVRGDIAHQADGGALEGHCPDEQDGEDKVGEQRREPDHLEKQCFRVNNLTSTGLTEVLFD